MKRIRFVRLNAFFFFPSASKSNAGVSRKLLQTPDQSGRESDSSNPPLNSISSRFHRLNPDAGQRPRVDASSRDAPFSDHNIPEIRQGAC